MSVVTGRGAARDHDDRPTGPAAGDDAGPAPGGPRGGAVAPQPRPVPGTDPMRDGSTRPSPTPTRAAPPAAAQDATTQAGSVVEVETTTGAPVDALPRRVPVRQQNRRHRRGRAPDGGTPGDDAGSWAPIEEVHWDGTPVREETPQERDRTADQQARRRPARPTHPPDPLPGLAALLVLSLVASFFAWVSAGPFWLAVGHARTGTVVIDDCTGGGLTQRCRGIFAADDGRFLAHGVRVSGVPAGRDAPGTALPARMTGPDGGTAYADTGVGRHLRWLPGLLVVLGCAFGIARWTGATRLAGRRNRRWAVTAALAGPALITLGFLAAAW
ncbi:hypothetical protein ACFOW4_22575 [Micromonospora sp. GCM10011542]|uniref:hypothetical protein n=1 Tax=Micromonospora sp. GCM10011542 TaxID=3317337 RepID=UPI00360C18DF